MADYSAHASRGGGYKQFRTELPRRSKKNEQDLALVMKARDKAERWDGARRAAIGATSTGASAAFKQMIDHLRRTPTRILSPKQRAWVCGFLGVPVPEMVDPVPAACRVLPLKPPSRVAGGGAVLVDGEGTRRSGLGEEHVEGVGDR